MLIKKWIFTILLTIVSFGIFACNDTTVNSDDEQNLLTLADGLDPKACNDTTEGSMVFIKPTTTMYVCTDAKWTALSNEEAIQYRCTSKQLQDKSGISIICDETDTIGVIYNGTKGQNGISVDTAAIYKVIKDSLSAATAKNQSGMDSILKNLSTATEKFKEEISGNTCAIKDTVRDNEIAIFTVTIQCGKDETEIKSHSRF